MQTVSICDSQDVSALLLVAAVGKRVEPRVLGESEFLVVAVGKRVLAVCGMLASASELSSHSKELLSWPDTLRTLFEMGPLRSDPSAHACLLASANKTSSARMQYSEDMHVYIL